MTCDKVVIAGATGFVGRRLREVLGDEYDLICLSRSISPEVHGTFSALPALDADAVNAATDDDNVAEIESAAEEASTLQETHEGWRHCDLFSLLDAEKGVRGARYAIYLVHSMMPSARLMQAHFRDLDLVAADNFARAAAAAGVEQIIYLGGIIPEGEELSEHLESRLEVEQTLGAYGVPVTSLRAGLILGEGGSSFEMLVRLVKRLPVMVCPAWTETLNFPIALDDVVALVRFCLGNEDTYAQDFDIAGPEEISYRALIETTAKVLGKTRLLFRFPLFTPGLSRLWVSLITGAPKELVQPLIKSLRHKMQPRDRRLQEMADVPGIGVEEALRTALATGKETKPSIPVAYQRNTPKLQQSDVRSLQRMPLPPGKDATFVAEEYMRWLPRLLPWFIHVKVDDDGTCTFAFRWIPIPLLVLKYSEERSKPDRRLLYIRGGWLAYGKGRGRLEFREMNQGRCLIAGIHEFRPRLPWYIYIYTQALAHLWVMIRFRKHLQKLCERAPGLWVNTEDAESDRHT